MPNLGLGLSLNRANSPKILYPKNVAGNVLSLIASKANKGNVPTSATKVWSDQSKIINSVNYSNGVTNPDFENDLTGWTTAGTITASTEQFISGTKSSKLVTSANSAYEYQEITATNGDILYCRAMGYLSSFTSGNLGVQAYDKGGWSNTVSNYINNTLLNQWQKASCIKTASNGGIRFVTGSGGTNTYTGYIDNTIVINLTSLGLGHLSVAQCDELFAFTTLGASATLTRYNPLDWAQWTKSYSAGSSIVANSNGITLNVYDAYVSITYNTSCKTNTKYGLLLNVVSNNLSYDVIIDANCAFTTGTVVGGAGTTGNKKVIMTSLSSFVANTLTIKRSANEASLKSITLKDIRLFELPSGSQIETDFTNLTANQLNVLYPMGYGEAVATMPNDCTLNNLGGTGTSGFNSEVNANSGKTVSFLKLDGTDDYGAFANVPSLDITTNEFALACTFRLATGAGFGWLINKTLDASNVSQYGLLYGTSTLQLFLNGISQKTITTLENGWYNVIFYRNSSGVISTYINKVSQSTVNYATALISQPNINLGCRSASVNGVTRVNFLKGDIATQSIYQAPTLDINKIIKAETNLAKLYTGVA